MVGVMLMDGALFALRRLSCVLRRLSRAMRWLPPVPPYAFLRCFCWGFASCLVLVSFFWPFYPLLLLLLGLEV